MKKMAASQESWCYWCGEFHCKTCGFEEFAYDWLGSSSKRVGRNL